MVNYKQRLLEELLKDDWKRLDVLRTDVSWWADEHWKMQSVREQWATELFISFVIDPVWDAPRRDGQGLKQIVAFASLPGQDRSAATEIASIELDKDFEEKLLPFVYSLNYYRRTVCVDT